MTRLHTITEKVERDKTGLAASLFVHVDFDANWKAVDVRFSYKWKDNSTMDDVLTVLGDVVSAILTADKNAESS